MSFHKKLQGIIPNYVITGINTILIDDFVKKEYNNDVNWGCSGLDGGGWSRIASREVPTS